MEEQNVTAPVCTCAINGFPVYNTPKILEEIAGTQVITLLDSGSSHNVVNVELVEKLSLETESIQKFRGTLADGKQVVGATQCRDLRWRAGNVEFQINALVLPLFEHDQILGMQWFETLGTISGNFSERYIQFKYQDQEVVLRAIPTAQIHKPLSFTC